MILDVLDAFDNVAQDSGVIRDLDPQSIFNCSHGAEGVNRRSDASYTLRDRPGLARVAPLEDQLDAPEHGAGRPGVCHLAALDLDFDPQVPLDSGDGINRNLWHI